MGIAFLTIMVNGFLAGVVVRLLKLVQPNPMKQLMINEFLKQMQRKFEAQINEIKDVPDYDAVDWEEVRKACSIQDIKSKLKKFRYTQKVSWCRRSCCRSREDESGTLY
jgi:hypothetical protein